MAYAPSLSLGLLHAPPAGALASCTIDVSCLLEALPREDLEVLQAGYEGDPDADDDEPWHVDADVRGEGSADGGDDMAEAADAAGGGNGAAAHRPGATAISCASGWCQAPSGSPTGPDKQLEVLQVREVVSCAARPHRCKMLDGKRPECTCPRHALVHGLTMWVWAVPEQLRQPR
jgi:hypothetical protein